MDFDLYEEREKGMKFSSLMEYAMEYAMLINHDYYRNDMTTFQAVKVSNNTPE